MYDIDETRHLDWSDVATRTDGTPVAGEIGYNVELVKEGDSVAFYSFPPTGEPLFSESAAEINFAESGVEPGLYTAYVRAHEQRPDGVVRVSARSNGVPLDLRRFADPAAPTGFVVR